MFLECNGSQDVNFCSIHVIQNVASTPSKCDTLLPFRVTFSKTMHATVLSMFRSVYYFVASTVLWMFRTKVYIFFASTSKFVSVRMSSDGLALEDSRIILVQAICHVSSSWFSFIFMSSRAECLQYNRGYKQDVQELEI